MAYWNKQGELVGETTDPEFEQRIRKRMDETTESYKTAYMRVRAEMVREAAETTELRRDGELIPSHLCPRCKGRGCQHCRWGKVPDEPWPGWLDVPRSGWLPR